MEHNTTNSEIIYSWPYNNMSLVCKETIFFLTPDTTIIWIKRLRMYPIPEGVHLEQNASIAMTVPT